MNNKKVYVYKHRGIDICVLKKVIPSRGDSFKYVADGKEYDLAQEAID